MGASGGRRRWCTFERGSIGRPAPSRLVLAGLLTMAACRSSEAAAVEHAPIELEQTQRSTLARLAGPWRHVGGPQEQAAALQAVEQATTEMSALIRGMARSRLEEAVRIDGTLSIEERQASTAPAHGREYELQTADGDDARASLRVDEHGVVARVVTDQGGGERTYRVDDQGQLVITSRTFSPRLPADVVFTATYARP